MEDDLFAEDTEDSSEEEVSETETEKFQDIPAEELKEIVNLLGGEKVLIS